jgi:hypothetical protein
MLLSFFITHNFLLNILFSLLKKQNKNYFGTFFLHKYFNNNIEQRKLFTNNNNLAKFPHFL